MNEELEEQVEKLKRSIAELKEFSTKALGFVKTVEYDGISFNVSRRFVIADLSPLAFFHLIEPIETYVDTGIQAAVIALHHRLLPLLSCTHEWAALKREDDERVLAIMSPDGLRTGLRPRICKFCTAYALGQALPMVGRAVR